MKAICFRCAFLTGPLHSGAELHGFLSVYKMLYFKQNIKF